MKSLIFSIVLLVSVQMNAQKPIAENHKPKFTPEQQAELHSKHLALQLDLSEKQLRQVQALLLDRAQKKEVRRATRKAELESGNKPSSEILFKRRSAMLDEQMIFQKKMQAILNEEQYKQWKLNQKRHHKKRLRQKPACNKR